MVLVEYKISSLILSFKEMNNLSFDKTANLIPQITDEDYTTKYIESLSHYQNAEWNISLNGFKFLRSSKAVGEMTIKTVLIPTPELGGGGYKSNHAHSLGRLQGEYLKNANASNRNIL